MGELELYRHNQEPPLGTGEDWSTTCVTGGGCSPREACRGRARNTATESGLRGGRGRELGEVARERRMKLRWSLEMKSEARGGAGGP